MIPTIEEDYKYRSSSYCAVGDIQFKESEEDTAKKVVPLTANRRNRIRRNNSQDAPSLSHSDHSPLRPPVSATRNTTENYRSPQRPSLSTRASSTRRIEANQKRIPISQSEHAGSTSKGAAMQKHASNRTSTEHLSGNATRRSRVYLGGGGGRRIRRSGVDPLSQSEHIQRKPNMMHRPHNSPIADSLAENIPSTSSVQDTTLELLDLIQKRRRKQAARLNQGGISIKPPKPIQRHRSMGSATASPSKRTTAPDTTAILSPPPSKQPPKPFQRQRSTGSATASPSRTIATTAAVLSPPPSKQPPRRVADDSDISSDSDEESSQNSPKSMLSFTKGDDRGRKRRSNTLSPQITVLYTEEEKERMRLENARKQQEVNRMKVEMEQMQHRLAEIEQQKNQDLAQMKQAQEESKAKMKAVAKAKLAEHLENELELHLLAMEVEKKRMVALQEALEEEQEELKSTKAEWKEANKVLVEENDHLQAANDELFRMYKHLTKWVQKKTRHNAKLIPAEAKLIKILKGSIVLIVEAKLSKMYRKWMYRVAKAVNASDMYDFELDEGIQNIVQECEIECNKEGIPMVDVEEWIAQQQQDEEEEDPMFEFLQALEWQQEQGPTTTGSTTITNQDLRPMEKPSSQNAGGDNESSADDEDDNNFENDMEDLDRSMRVYEQVLADISVKLDATQMSTLYENKQMLLTIFRFLDTDKSGDIDADEFSFGIELLNKRLPEESHFQEHEELFRLLDVDGNGTIDIQEFERIFIDHY